MTLFVTAVPMGGEKTGRFFFLNQSADFLPKQIED